MKDFTHNIEIGSTWYQLTLNECHGGGPWVSNTVLKDAVVTTYDVLHEHVMEHYDLDDEAAEGWMDAYLVGVLDRHVDLAQWFKDITE